MPFLGLGEKKEGFTQTTSNQAVTIEPVVVFQFPNTFAAAAAGSCGPFLLLAALGSSRETCFSTVESFSRPKLSCPLTQVTGDAAFRETGVILPIIVFLTDK